MKTTRNHLTASLSNALREGRQEVHQYNVNRERFDAKVMYKDLVYTMNTEPVIEADVERLGTRGMNKAHSAIRGAQGRDKAIENAFRVAHNDFASQRAQQQREERKAYRQAKKDARR